MFHLVYVSLPVPLRDSLPRRVRDYTRSHNYAQPVWIEAATAMSTQVKTLFRQSVGRTDLPGGSGRDLLGSIVTKLLVLDDDTVVLPGHGEKSTIGLERRTNPFLEGLTL